MFKFFTGLVDSNEKEIKRLQPKVDLINGLEPEFEKLTDAELKARTDEFKARLPEPSDSVQPELAEAQQELVEAKECLAKATWEVENEESNNRCKRAQDKINAIEKE